MRGPQFASPKPIDIYGCQLPSVRMPWWPLGDGGSTVLVSFCGNRSISVTGFGNLQGAVWALQLRKVPAVRKTSSNMLTPTLDLFHTLVALLASLLVRSRQGRLRTSVEGKDLNLLFYRHPPPERLLNHNTFPNHPQWVSPLSPSVTKLSIDRSELLLEASQMRFGVHLWFISFALFKVSASLLPQRGKSSQSCQPVTMGLLARQMRFSRPGSQCFRGFLNQYFGKIMLCTPSSYGSRHIRGLHMAVCILSIVVMTFLNAAVALKKNNFRLQNTGSKTQVPFAKH